MPPSIEYPVTDPTWYDTIRHMFDQTDVAHMSKQGLDLTSYAQVKASSGPIYGQVSTGGMPPGRPWSADMVQTFLNWMSNDYPKGTPAADQERVALLAEAAPAGRIRREVTELTDDAFELVRKAFQGIMAKDPTDPNGYFVQAGYHWLPAPLYCQHHVPAYNPWHRAYLVSFENALRAVPGCETVTLPYWDITQPFPDRLKAAPFDSYTLPDDIGGGFGKGYVTQRYDDPTIAANLKRFEVTDDLERALTKTDWEDFHGWWSGATNNTIISAHDGGHGAIGPTMSNQSIAAFDPVFWFFHANWDRLWWEWQKKMHATDLTGLLSTIDKKTDAASHDLFTVPVLQKLQPFSSPPTDLDSVKVIDSVGSLDVDYAPPPASRPLIAFAPKTRRDVSVASSVSVDPRRVNVRVDGLNRLKIPGSFSVHLLKDGEPLATRFMFQPNEADKCENCVENPIAHFDFELPLEAVSGGKLRVQVEPDDTDFVGDRFPTKLMGEPTVSVHLLVATE